MLCCVWIGLTTGTNIEQCDFLAAAIIYGVYFNLLRSYVPLCVSSRHRVACRGLQALLPTYNILDGAQVLLEAHKVGQRLVGDFGVKAILPCEYLEESTAVCDVAQGLCQGVQRQP